MTVVELTHTYHGPGFRVDLNGTSRRPELISGAFKVLARGEGSALLGNGETPETRWVVYDLDRLELTL